MKNAFLWFGLVASVSAVIAKPDYFPDVSEEDYRKLQEIARFLQERLQEAKTAKTQTQSQLSKYEINQPFQYNLPIVNPKNDDFQPFAVGPFDPRYYEDFGRPIEHSDKISDSVGESKEKRPKSLDISKETSSDVDDPSQSHVRKIPVTRVYVEDEKADIYFTAIVAGCSAAAVVAVIATGLGCYRLQKNAKAAADVDYPAYGVTGPVKDVSPTSVDRRLAQSAQMYHYQHQKQQIIAMESMSNKERRSSISEAESDDENEEGDYTVYECPGLASTGEMEVKNPLFQDDQTPAPKTSSNLAEESRELPKDNGQKKLSRKRSNFKQISA